MATIDYYDSKTGQKKSLDLGPLASLEDLPKLIRRKGDLLPGSAGNNKAQADTYQWRGKTYVGNLPPEVQRVYDAYSGSGAGGVNLPSALPQTSQDALIQKAFEERDKANAANNKRYQQALGGIPQSQRLVEDSFLGIDRALQNQRSAVGGLYQQALGSLDTSGETARNDIRREYGNREAGNSQDLISRGLYSSTIANSMSRRNSEAKDRSLNAVDESVRGQKAGLYTQYAGAESDLLGRQAEAKANKLGLQLGLQQEKRNIIGSKVDEGPNFGDIASYYAALEQAKAQRKSSKSSLFGGLLGQLGGAAIGGLFSAI